MGLRQGGRELEAIMRMRLVGSSILAWVLAGGCAAPAGQVRASRPHATVHVHIEHGGEGHSFSDAVYVDGLLYGLDGRPLLLRLAPGKHELELVSQQTELGVALVSYLEDETGCRTPSCNDVAVRVPRRNERLELTDHPRQECARTVVIDAEAGEVLQATLRASADGTCSLDS
jgi:hypothetical protein